MVDDSGAQPLPRRVPGASGSPRPTAPIERTPISEDLRQRVLSAIAVELERDKAEHWRRAPEQGGSSPSGAVNEPVTGQVSGAGQVPDVGPGAGAVLADGVTTMNGITRADSEVSAYAAAPAADGPTMMDGPALANGATLAYGTGPAAGEVLASGAAPADSDVSANGGAPADDEGFSAGAALADGAALTDAEDLAAGAALADGPTMMEGPALANGATLAYGMALAGGTAPAGGAPSADDAPHQVAPGPEGVPEREVAAEATAPAEAAPRPDVPLPRRAPGANGARQPPAQLRREYLPPALLGRRLDSDAHTEPIPEISGILPAGRTPRHDAQPAASGTATPPAFKAPTGPPGSVRSAAAPPSAGPLPTASSTAEPSDAMPALAAPVAPPEAPPVPPKAGPAPVALERPVPRTVPRPRRPGRPYRIAGLVLAVLALAAAAVIALVLSGHTPRAGHSTGSGARRGTIAVRNRAAAWVADQVSRAAVVACDPVTCQALRSHGVPASSLYQLGPQTTSPLRSQVIVATATVRDQFGSLLGSVYAPAVLASFGAGPDRIDIRQTAQRGAATYRAMLRADLANRRASGSELLHSNRIAASFAARRQLVAGRVDPRLLLAIAQMAAMHPIYIVDFGHAAPGAGPDMPLRQADLAEDVPAGHDLGHVARAGYVRSMVSLLRAQRGQFRPAYFRTVYLSGGAAVLRIEFTAPSPLGLLGPHA